MRRAQPYRSPRRAGSAHPPDTAALRRARLLPGDLLFGFAQIGDARPGGSRSRGRCVGSCRATGAGFRSPAGSRRASRPMVRHQPQLRLDCSAPIRPFSHSTTEWPFSARNSAVDVPMMPPPITTTPARAGSAGVGGTRSTGGDMWRRWPVVTGSISWACNTDHWTLIIGALREMAWRVGVDSGGTFTDVCLFDEDSGRVEVWKVAVHAGRSVARHRAERCGGRGACRCVGRRDRLFRPWHDRGDQRADPASRREDWPDHHRRVSRPAGNRPAEAA